VRRLDCATLWTAEPLSAVKNEGDIKSWDEKQRCCQLIRAGAIATSTLARLIDCFVQAAERKWSARTLTALISGAAGVMLTASFFSLLQPAIALARA